MMTCAKLVAQDYDADLYAKPIGKRGQPGYVMSRGALNEFWRCPSRWRKGYTSKGSDSTEWGSLIDCLLLTPEAFPEKFTVKPETYTNEKGEKKPWNGNATKCKEWAELQIGKTLVSAEDYRESGFALKQTEFDPDIKRFIGFSARQVYCTAEWHDVETDLMIPLKVLIDLVPDGNHADYALCLGDFKTARDAKLRSWQRQVFDFGYHVQAALYLDVFNAATGSNRNDFRHIVQENVAPYQTAKRIIDREFIQLGRMSYQCALSAYAQCLKTDCWPDYDSHTDGMNGWSFVKPEAWMMQL